MKTVIISDLKQYVPKEAQAAELEKFKWRIVEYETAEFSGSLLFANMGANAPEITIDPQLRGWYTIKLGLWNPSEAAWDTMTRFRLTKDLAWSRISGDGSNPGKTVFMESVWKDADMTGQQLRIAQPSKIEPAVASSVAFIKFEPLSEQEVAKIKADRERKDTKRLVGTHDMHYLFYTTREPGQEEFLEELEAYRHTDFDILHFEYQLGGDEQTDEMNWAFDAKADAIFRSGDVLYAHNMRYLKSHGLAMPMYQMLAKYAREMGKKFYIGYRMNAFNSDPPYDNIFKTKFYDNNPQWRCKDADGGEVARMSYAFPEVQERVISFFLYLLKTGCDGIAMFFHRCFPYVMYEAPAVERFMSKHNIDPHTLPEDDPRWLDCKAEIMTEFVRRVRAALDEYAKTHNRPRLSLAAYLLVDPHNNRQEGLDGKRWAQEGLVDEIIANDLAAEYVADIDIDYYVDMVKDTDTKVYICLEPRQIEPEGYRKKALDAYGRGADGLALWDSYQRQWTLYRWTMARRLGHAKELSTWDDGEGTHFRRIRLLKLGGKRVDRYWATMGL